MLSKASTLAVGCLVALVLIAKFAFFQPAPPLHAKFNSPEGKSWAFDSAKHGRLHSLSRSQCSVAFPHLYDRIDVAVSQRERKNSPITRDDIRIAPGRCMLKVLIYDGELYITDLGDHLECYVSNGRERIVATLNLINRAIAASPEALPNIEFPISYDDLPTRSTPGVVWGYARKEDEDNIWLLPDYGYWSWWAVGIASFNSLSRSISEVNTNTAWRGKKPQAVWRGTTHYAPTLRQGLIDTTRDKAWADVKTATLGNNEENFLPLDDHCRYQYVLQTEGTSYTGRFKFLQLCNSVTVAHKLDYAEFATHLMRASGPDQNFVQVERDWSDLDTKMQHLLAHPSEAEAIATRSHEVFAKRYLTPAGVSCYIRRLVEGWSEIQGFEPELFETDEITGTAKIRGIPFEAFAVSFPQDKPGEYGRFAPG